MKDQLSINIGFKNKTFNFYKPLDTLKKLKGYKIGDKIELSTLDIILEDASIVKITGGSTSTGTPMNSSLPGVFYKKIKYKQNILKGYQRRFRVAGSNISEDCKQVNLVVC